MTTQEIITRIRNKILESTSEIITDTQILQDLNFINDDITKRTFTNALITSSVIDFTTSYGGHISLGQTGLPSDFGTAYGDAVDTIGNFYKEVNLDDYDKKTQPYAYTIRAGTVIQVFPITTPSLTLKYWPKTTVLSLAHPILNPKPGHEGEIIPAVDPTIDSLLQKCLISGALAEIYEDLQDEQLATYYKQKYEMELQQRLATLSNYEEENKMSGEMFTAQQLI